MRFNISVIKKGFIFFALVLHQINAPVYSIGIYGVEYSVEYNEKDCTKEYPLKITVNNKTIKKLNSFWVELSATLKGRSTVVYKAGGFSSDKIINRFSKESFCFTYKDSRPYPGEYDKIEEDGMLNVFQLTQKYGHEIGMNVHWYHYYNRRNGIIPLDPKYKIDELNLYISNSRSNFD